MFRQSRSIPDIQDPRGLHPALPADGHLGELTSALNTLPLFSSIHLSGSVQNCWWEITRSSLSRHNVSFWRSEEGRRSTTILKAGWICGPDPQRDAHSAAQRKGLITLPLDADRNSAASVWPIKAMRKKSESASDLDHLKRLNAWKEWWLPVGLQSRQRTSRSSDARLIAARSDAALANSWFLKRERADYNLTTSGNMWDLNIQRVQIRAFFPKRLSHQSPDSLQSLWRKHVSFTANLYYTKTTMHCCSTHEAINTVRNCTVEDFTQMLL